MGRTRAAAAVRPWCSSSPTKCAISAVAAHAERAISSLQKSSTQLILARRRIAAFCLSITLRFGASGVAISRPPDITIPLAGNHAPR